MLTSNKPLGSPRPILPIVAALLLASCGEKSPPAVPVADVTPIDPATAGTITVVVSAEGTVPPPQPINMSAVAGCAKLHEGPVYDQSLTVNNGRVQDAVVWIKSGFGGRRFATPTEPVVIDQQGCLYRPRVVGVMVGQVLQFVNSDPEAHNVHGRPQAGSGWNFIMSRQGSSRSITFDKPEVAVPVSCDIHPWMHASVSVFDNPYFGVTPPDGTVTLRDVPPGQYEVACWHEKLGTKAQSITLAPKGSATVDCRYTVSQ